MKIKQTLYILVFSIILIFAGTTYSHASLRLNHMDFQAYLKEDGSMDVIEIWDINISDTNTLFKTFDNKKFGTISNVSVREITPGAETTFEENSKWEYHLPKGRYYGGKNQENDFEISWGVSINSNTTKKYEVSYTVTDCLKKYGDATELYWQFIGDKFEVNADSIRGVIYLPERVSKESEVKVWEHLKYLNGEIYFIDNDRIEFTVDKYQSGTYVEVRALMPNYLFPGLEFTSQNKMTDKIVEEETKWAEEANARRKRRDNTMKGVAGAVMAILGAFSVFDIRKIKKYKQELDETPKIKPEMELDYFREVPDEKASPTEAQYMLYRMPLMSTSLSASILDLVLKGYLTAEQNDKKINISIVQNKVIREEDDLPKDEKMVLELIRKAYDSKKKTDGQDYTITMKEFEKYIINHPTSFETLSRNTREIVKDAAVKKQKLDLKREEKSIGYSAKSVGYFLMTIISIVFMIAASVYILGYFDNLIKFILVFGIFSAIVAIINTIMCGRLSSRLHSFTQKGENEKEQWKAFIKYMEDFSMLDEREVPELILWEKFLVYATAFGIADKVIKQLKVKYPELNNSETVNNMALFSAMNGPNGLNTNFVSSINTATSHMYSSTMSSGSGGGGGASGGGGGRRSVAAEAGGR